MRVELRDLQDEAVATQLVGAVAEVAAEVAGVDLGVLSLVLVDDEGIGDINRQFRGVDGATDVIAFEAEEVGGELAGEVIISVETAGRQARDAGHGLNEELAWLVAHGVLHVSGMSDATEEGLDSMLSSQSDVMARMGLEVGR